MVHNISVGLKTRPQHPHECLSKICPFLSTLYNKVIFVKIQIVVTFPFIDGFSIFLSLIASLGQANVIELK